MRSVFSAGSTAMARIPLTPVNRPPAPGLLAEGVFLASRSLERAAPTPRAAAAHTAYALRASTRTTPNGVWSAAGVAILKGTGPATVRWSGRHRTLTTPAPHWLTAVAERHLEDALPNLAVSANNLAVRRGDRRQAARPGAEGEAVLGSIAATSLSDWVLATCARRTSVRDLLVQIRRRHPEADEQQATTALVHLVRTGMLLTDLLPEDLRADPLPHFVQRLGRAHSVSGALIELRTLLRRADGHSAGSSRRLQLLRCAADVADEIHRVEKPFVVDTVLTDDLPVPADVGARAAEAASFLWLIGHRTGPLQKWTRRFTDLYGRHRLVPLLEAVDPVTGVGPPAPEDAIGAGSALDGARARHLAALHSDALARGAPEIALTDNDLRRLHAPDGAEPPATAEIHVRLVARTDGTSTLVVGPHAAQDAGSAATRLGHLLPGLVVAQTAEDAASTVQAEIVCRPLTARTAALAVPSGTLSHRIPIGVPVREGDLDPADLAIASTGARLILWSHRLAAPVRPVLLSRITRDLLPAAAQLLYLLGHVGERPWHPFTWTQTLPHSPYTPRVTFRGTVLAPQRWTLPDCLIQAAGQRGSWTAQADAWIAGTRPRLPDSVLAEESDRHLLIDLTDPEHREILRRSVAAGARTVAEAIGYTPTHAPVEGPDGRHLLELVVPLDCHGPRPVPPAPNPRTLARPRRHDQMSVRDGWLSIALAVPTAHQDAALLQLPALPGVRLSYWLRYRTAELGPHLRVRAHVGSAASFGDPLAALARWAERLADGHMSDGLLRIEPYVRETQRYGGVDAIARAEAVFAVDSANTLGALRADDATRLVLAARTIRTLATTLAPGQAHLAVRGAALAVAERRRRDELRTLTGAPLSSPLAATEREHAAALDALAATLSPDVAAAVASDVTHMHCNRLLGLDAGAERIARSLAVDLLHRR